MKVVEEVEVAVEAKAVKQESVSSESESEEEAEYHPNVSVSFSNTQIPEEKEEEVEQEKKEEKKTSEQDTSAPDAPALPVEVSQPVESTVREGEEDTGAEKKNAEEEQGGVTEESTDEPMLTPEEAPNGLTLPEESITVAAEAEEEPKMNGEASLVEAEPRPQVICCSEVKSSPGRLRSFPRALTPPTNCRKAHYFFSFLLTSVPVSFLLAWIFKPHVHPHTHVCPVNNLQKYS